MPSSLGPYEGTPFIGGVAPGVIYVDNTGLQRLSTYPADGAKYLDGNGNWTTPAGTGTGEANDATNLGTGTHIFVDKTGVTLRFRSVISSDGTVLVSADANEIDLKASPASIGADPAGSAAAVQANLDSHAGDLDIHFGVADIDHGAISGLGDDDHPQYHTDARGDARYYQQSQFINASLGAADAGKPIVLDAAGKLDASFVEAVTETDPIFTDSPAGSILDQDITNWNTAFTWGDHSTAGYLKNESDPVFMEHPAYGITGQQITNWDVVYGWGNHNTQGYLKVEADPIFTNHPSYGISQGMIDSWDDAVLWGDHAQEGYLTTETDPFFTNSAAASIDATMIGNWNAAYLWGDHSTQGYIPDAPSDGTEYARKNGTWTTITSAGIPEAPTDGQIYARQNGGWVLAPGGGAEPGEANRGENIGTGSQIYAGMNGANLQLRSVSSPDSTVVIAQTANEIQLTASPASIGADPTGSADAVQANLDAHTGDATIHYTDIGATEDTQYVRINLAGIKQWKKLVETDPVFSVHVASTITQTNINNWNAAFGWGDHSTFGYLDELPVHTHPWSEITDTAPFAILSTGFQIQVNGASQNFQFTHSNISSDRPWYYFRRSQGTDSNIQPVASGYALGGIVFQGADSASAWASGSTIQANATGAPGDGFVPSNLAFTVTSTAGDIASYYVDSLGVSKPRIYSLSDLTLRTGSGGLGNLNIQNANGGNTTISASIGTSFQTTAAPTNAVDINSDAFRLRTKKVDFTQLDVGQMAWDDDGFWICVTGGTWKQIPFTVDVPGQETDPFFTASAAAGITVQDILNWDTAYSWGNHADAGYIAPDAPSDGKTYGRKDGLWAEVVGGGGSTPPGGTSNQVQYNAAGVFGGTNNITISDGLGTYVNTTLYCAAAIRLANNKPIQGTLADGLTFPWLMNVAADDNLYTYVPRQADGTGKVYKIVNNAGSSITWFQDDVTLPILNFRGQSIQLNAGNGTVPFQIQVNQDIPGTEVKRAGNTTDQSYYTYYNDYSSGSVSVSTTHWMIGKQGGTKNYLIQDYANSITRLLMTPNGRTNINGAGAWGVYLNADPNSGTAGLLIYSGGASPQVWTRIASRAIFSNGNSDDQRICGGSLNDGGTIICCGSTQGSYPNSIVFRQGVQDIGIANASRWQFRATADFSNEITNTTTTINLQAANHQTLNVSSLGADSAVTLTPPLGSASGTLLLQQGATAYNLTFAVTGGTIVWLTGGDGSPDFSQDASSWRCLSWRWDGTRMFLIPSQKDVA